MDNEKYPNIGSQRFGKIPEHKMCNFVGPLLKHQQDESGKDRIVHETKRCSLPSVSGFTYCHHHIKKFPDEYEKFCRKNDLIYSQKLQTPLPPLSGKKKYRSKYNFLNKELRNSVADLLISPELLSLKHEISILQNLLQSLINNSTPERLTKTEYVKNQIAIINQIRLLIKTMKEVETNRENEISVNDLKVFIVNVANIITSHVQDEKIRERIGEEVFIMYQTALRPKDETVRKLNFQSMNVNANVNEEAFVNQ